MARLTLEIDGKDLDASELADLISHHVVCGFGETDRMAWVRGLLHALTERDEEAAELMREAFATPPQGSAS